jgi:hypothetical protein
VTAVWIAIALVLVVAAAVVPVVAGRRNARGGAAATTARARYALLGRYAENPVSTTDPRAEDLLRQARERWNTCGGLLSTARSAEDYALARGVAEDGLALVTKAYRAIGLPAPPR